MNTNDAYEKIIQEWNREPIRNTDDLDVRLSNFRVLFAYHSNVVENPETTLHDTREIFENGKVTGYTGSTRTLFELQNQKFCYEYLKPRIVEGDPVTPELICKIHEVLMRGCYDEARYNKGERPGKYKIHDFVTGDNIGSAPETVEEEIRELCEEVAEAEGDPLTIGAYLHLIFETIHPFADGNGRAGRTLMNYYLMTHGHPPIILFDDDKRTYYLALAVFDKTGELKGFREFLKEETVRTWTKDRGEGRPRLADLI